jgi:hypothetical protein
MNGRLTLAAIALLAVFGAGCESTHDKAVRYAELDAASGAKAAHVTTETIDKNAAISTKVAAVLSSESQDGVLTAVVVELTSKDKARSVLWAPIDVVVKDAAGKEVGKTNIPGANPLLIHVPSLPAGGTAYYVNDQIAPDAMPATAAVTLGGTLVAMTPPPGTLKVTGKIVIDPDYGPSFVGTVTNTADVRQEQIIIQGIARRGGKIVAAGTSNVLGLEPGASADYVGSLIGDSKGAKLEVFAPVSNVKGQKGAPAAAG